MCHPVEEGPTPAAGPPSLNGCIPFRGATQNFGLPARHSPPSSIGPICSLENGDGVFCLSCPKEGTNDPEQTRTLLRLCTGQETVQDLRIKHDRGEDDQIGYNKGKWWKN